MPPINKWTETNKTTSVLTSGATSFVAKEPHPSSDNTSSAKNCVPLVQILPFVGLLLCTALMVYAYQIGLFSSLESLQAFVIQAGLLAPIIFILLQIVQVVIPIVPGGLTCVAGVLLFGPSLGFLYNYVSICAGSLLVFAISRAYGCSILHMLFPRKMIEKYHQWTAEKNRFSKLFTYAIVFPVAPDDFLCYLAGTTTMSFRRFTTIILLGKPLPIFIYGIGLASIISNILSF